MATQETVAVMSRLIFTTEDGEVPDAVGFLELYKAQMGGCLNEETGLSCFSIEIWAVTGDLEVADPAFDHAASRGPFK